MELKQHKKSGALVARKRRQNMSPEQLQKRKEQIRIKREAQSLKEAELKRQRKADSVAAMIAYREEQERKDREELKQGERNEAKQGLSSKF